ncbi:hypothetical protein PYCCODRAFT_1415288 [Trametes coccinea BRFM310]|uniref:Uncharacterized protein n=1 Tax=Trametes coccinea (strain BRFM310) TaxID=1353009 RepID=A0A1Y2IGZ0_TRAC3|nr:hypothetical protein PYCCODRAFT_1415288 [Trametes coccinea BRFM310]
MNPTAPTPSSSSSSYTSQEPPPRSELWWDRVPSLKIVRPPKGPFSPKVDERCLTYCSQTVTGRIHGSDPWCRSLCIRKVFLHEVTRVLSRRTTETIVHHPTQPGRPPRREITEVIETAPVHHPLPPEGQRYSGWLQAFLRRPAHPDPDLAHPDAQAHDDKGALRYWKAGWYLWWSKSRWAAQERMDLMRRSLGSQTDWQQLKDRRNEEWQRGGVVDEARFNEDVQQLFNPNLPPFPDTSQDSILLPLPDTLPLGEQLHNVLAPTWKLLGLVRDSVSSGAQKELATRLYAKALTDEPIKLLRVACSMIWENMGFSGDGEDSDDTKRKP